MTCFKIDFGYETTIYRYPSCIGSPSYSNYLACMVMHLQYDIGYTWFGQLDPIILLVHKYIYIYNYNTHNIRLIIIELSRHSVKLHPGFRGCTTQ